MKLNRNVRFLFENAHWIVPVTFFAACGATLFAPSSCSIVRTAPSSVEELRTMSEDEWQAWLESCSGWASAAGYSAVRFGGQDPADLQRFVDELGQRGWSREMFELAASAAELVRNPIVDQLLREAQALVNLKVDFTAGFRFAQWFERVRLGVADGVLRARAESEVQR